MKNSLILFLLLLLMTSCEKKDPTTVIDGPYITQSELNYIIYQQGDTFSFKNTQGKILNYVCSSRRRYQVTASNTIDDHTYLYVLDNLDIYLQCLSDSIYNIAMHTQKEPNYTPGESPTTLSMTLGLPNYNDSSYRSPLGGVLYLFINSTGCKLDSGLSSGPVICLDSIFINSKTYYNVTKTIYYGQLGSNDYDTLYYNQQYGILKYCIPKYNEIWERR